MVSFSTSNVRDLYISPADPSISLKGPIPPQLLPLMNLLMGSCKKKVLAWRSFDLSAPVGCQWFPKGNWIDRFFTRTKRTPNWSYSSLPQVGRVDWYWRITQSTGPTPLFLYAAVSGSRIIAWNYQTIISSRVWKGNGWYFWDEHQTDSLGEKSAVCGFNARTYSTSCSTCWLSHTFFEAYVMHAVCHIFTFAFAVCDDRMNSPPRQLLPKCRVFGAGSDGEPPVEQRCQSLGENRGRWSTDGCNWSNSCC